MKCAEGDGYKNTDHHYLGEGFRDGWTCGYCRGEMATDSSLLHHLLKRHNLTREQVLEEYRKDWKPEEV
jgi:hypothetical protein